MERTGTGTMEAVAGGGRRFLPGGQQRTDYAVVSPGSGPTSERSWHRAVGPRWCSYPRSTWPADLHTGRNIHTWFEIVSQDGPDDLVTGLLLQVDPEIGPYFGGAIKASASPTC